MWNVYHSSWASQPASGTTYVGPSHHLGISSWNIQCYHKCNPDSNLQKSIRKIPINGVQLSSWSPGLYLQIFSIIRNHKNWRCHKGKRRGEEKIQRSNRTRKESCLWLAESWKQRYPESESWKCSSEYICQDRNRLSSRTVSLLQHLLPASYVQYNLSSIPGWYASRHF